MRQRLASALAVVLVATALAAGSVASFLLLEAVLGTPGEAATCLAPRGEAGHPLWGGK